MDFADKLKQLRKDNNITQVRLAEYLDVERSSVGKYETGTIPSIDIIVKIANFFGVTVDYLIGRTDAQNGATREDEELDEYLEELKNRPEMKMLFSLAKGATKKDVEQAVAIIEALRKSENG